MSFFSHPCRYFCALLSVFSSTCNSETTNRIFRLFHTLKLKLKSFHVRISVSM
jgi:hypothetical protein